MSSWIILRSELGHQSFLKEIVGWFTIYTRYHQSDELKWLSLVTHLSSEGYCESSSSCYSQKETILIALPWFLHFSSIHYISASRLRRLFEDLMRAIIHLYHASIHLSFGLTRPYASNTARIATYTKMDFRSTSAISCSLPCYEQRRSSLYLFWLVVSRPFALSDSPHEVKLGGREGWCYSLPHALNPWSENRQKNVRWWDKVALCPSLRYLYSCICWRASTMSEDGTYRCSPSLGPGCITRICHGRFQCQVLIVLIVLPTWKRNGTRLGVYPWLLFS